jgi:propionyl-CoA carboxylase beta chain
MTARERIDALLDKGSFVELDMFVRHRATGFGIEDSTAPGRRGHHRVGHRRWPHRLRVRRGLHRVRRVPGRGGQREDLQSAWTWRWTPAHRHRVEGLGRRPDPGGVLALDGYGEIFKRNVMASGVIPQISVIMGPCAGGAVYSPAITDFVYQVEGTSHLFITGPDVIKAVTGEDVTFDMLGGAQSPQQDISGVTHFVSSDGARHSKRSATCCRSSPRTTWRRHLLHTHRSTDRMEEDLTTIVPDSPNQPYDMVELIEMVVDDGEFYEVHQHFAPNIVTGFARLDGYTVGIVGNNPSALAGTLDIDASVKGARFVRFCDAFNIPIVSFVDVPGFLPGVDQEHGGIIRHGAKLLYAYCEATVPRVTVITRKAYGGAYVVMNSRSGGR